MPEKVQLLVTLPKFESSILFSTKLVGVLIVNATFRNILHTLAQSKFSFEAALTIQVVLIVRNRKACSEMAVFPTMISMRLITTEISLSEEHVQTVFRVVKVVGAHFELVVISIPFV